MKWRILIVLDIAFSTISLVATLVLGNRMLARHVPTLHANATWLSKLVVKGLITPDNIAKWALGSIPVTVTVLVFVLCIAGESCLIMFSPLVERYAAVAASEKFSVDFAIARREIAAQRTVLRTIRREMLKGVMLRLVGNSCLAFVIGLAAGAIAWSVATLINLNTGGVLQALAVIVAIIILLILNDVLGEIVKEATRDDESLETLRERFTHAEP